MGSPWDEGGKVCRLFAESLIRYGFEVDEGEPTKEHDFSFMWGARSPRLVEEANSLGIPVLVFDLGYLKRGWNAFKKREGGYYQIGMNRICTIYPDASPHRWNDLGLEIKPLCQHSKNLLVLGQVPDDAQHHMDQVRLFDFYQTAKIVFAGYNIQFRPHPQAPQESPRGMKVRPSETLEEAFEWASYVFTFNSTAGLQAMLDGKCVYCDPSAFYYQTARESCLKQDNRIDLARKVANSQWNEEEIRSGQAFGDLLHYIYDYKNNHSV